MNAFAHKLVDDISEQPEINLFFVTRPGQLRNIATYIQQTGKTHNRLIALTTENEAALRPSLESAIPDGLFELVCWPILPGGPASPFGCLRRFKLYDTFDKAITNALGNVEGTPANEVAPCVRVHLFHPSAYYVYVLRILSAHGIRISGTVMLEEGLSSYKWCALPGRIDTYGKLHAVEAGKLDRADGLDHASEADRASGVTRIAKLAKFGEAALPANPIDVLVAAKDRLMPPRLQFDIIDYFDEGWFRHPDEMARSRQISFGRIERLNYNEIPSPSQRQVELAAEAPATLFIGQRFGDYDCSAEVIVSLLEIMGCTDVLYKAHPMEDAAQLDEALAAAMRAHPQMHVHRSPELDVIPVEMLVATGRFETVASLTSTALLYAPPTSPSSRFISLAGPYLELYPLLYELLRGHPMPSGHLQLLERDATVLANIASELQMPGIKK